MYKKIVFLTLCAIQACGAWTPRVMEPEKIPNAPGLNNPDNRRGFIEADYLFWLPHQDDLFYAIKEVTDSDATIATTHNTFKQPHFGLSSGVRLGIGGYTLDSWNVGVKVMYIYADANSRTGLPSNTTSQIIPDFNTDLFSITAAKARGIAKLNFGTLDFFIGREFFMTRRFAVHPLIGLRSFGMIQDFQTNYLSTYTSGTVIVPTTTNIGTSFKTKNDSWGIGPRAAIDLKFYMDRHWSFLGGLSGALFFSHYHVQQKFSGITAMAGRGAGTTELVPTILKTNDKDFCIRTNVDAYFGLGYDMWFNCNKNRFYIALLFEGSEWFAMNQFNDLSGSSGDISIGDLRRHGDLGFIGGTLHFQFDF